MNKQFSLNDDLNLRDFILLITDHIKLNGRAGEEPRTLVKFIELLLSGTVTDPKKQDSLIKEFQKAFSGNLPLSKMESLLQIFYDETYKDKIYENVCGISQTLFNVSNSDAFFRQTLKKISLRFFSQAEHTNLVALVDGKRYGEFLYQLILHGANTPYNVPCYFADRIYDEALTYDYDSPMRYALMREAADNGNKRAALEYGNFLAKHGPYDTAFDYLMLALPIPVAIWNVAFLLETHWVGASQLNQFRQTFKTDEKLSSEEFADSRPELDAVICSETNPLKYDELTYAYKTYFYLAQKGFFKAYNSLGKLLAQKRIIIKPDCTEFTADTLAKKYYQKAIQGGNIMAMCSEGSRLLKEEVASNTYAPDSTEERYLLELLQVSAETDVAHSYYNLGKYYEYAAEKAPSPPKSRDEICQIYEHALAIDIDKSSIHGDLLIRLGKLSQDPDKKKKYFCQALKDGAADAAYYLSSDYYERYIENGNEYDRRQADKLLEENLPYMSEKIKKEASYLSEALTE